MRDLITEAFDSVIRREIAEADDVRKEIARATPGRLFPSSEDAQS
ncbi:hypothetical protein [Bradyrhizobium sp. WSM1743]|nr:hypothetical protein [Bradyrhizobium sp. WSM1743]